MRGAVARPALHGRPADRAKGEGRHHPAGVTQADELDYTLHQPVTLEAVTIPDPADGGDAGAAG